MTATASDSFFVRHEFLIRRLHSLSGLVPVGAYMVVHLLTNATVLNGARSFQRAVDSIHSLGVLLPAVEWTFIFLPLIFHAVVGVAIIRSGTSNTSSYPYGGNIRYMLQRATAWIALAFIFYHVLQLHGWIKPLAHQLNQGKFSHLHATSSAADAIQASLWIVIAYAIGVLSCVYHLANGIWTSGITWGLWTTPAAQRRANWVCGAFGLVLAAVGMSALLGISTVDVKGAYETEQKINATKVAEGELSPEELEAHKPHLRALEPAGAPAPAKAQAAGEPTSPDNS
ncbi:MAG: succinate dehydrogenase cytochrome b558 subunit [Pirellulales bacterium]